MAEWNVVWSKYLHKRVSAIGFWNECVIISAEAKLSMINKDGDTVWTHQFPSSPYEIGCNEKHIIVLYGRGFQIIDPTDGTPFSDGKTVHPGFSKFSFRPGGGVILSDREGNLHLFDKNGNGKKMFEKVDARNIIGWLDREFVLIHRSDGKIISVDVNENSDLIVIGNNNYSWTSKLYFGKIICQTTNGSIWEGVPNKFGWDYIRETENNKLEPLISEFINGCWYMLTLEKEVIKLGNNSDENNMIGGEFFCSDNKNHIVTCTREGLLRWWQTIQDIRDINENLYDAVEDERRNLNRKQRKRIFENASSIEDSDIDESIRLYRIIDRIDDVERLETKKQSGDLNYK